MISSFQELLANPYLYLPDEEKTWHWVLQAHLRGLSVHGDLRFQISDDTLTGWTLNWVKGIKKEPKDLAEAKKIISKRLPKAFKELLDPNVKVVCETKQPEPIEWLTVESWFPPGTVGSTRFRSGSMIICDKGTVEFLTQKSYFHEYQIWGEHLKGRFVVRQLPNVWRKKSLATGEIEKTGRGHTVWMAFFADPEPYVISKRAVDKAWYPPEGFSCLPKYIRSQIKLEYRYWMKKGKEAHIIRDSLFEAIRSKNVSIIYPVLTKGDQLLKFAKEPKPKLPERPDVGTPSPSVEMRIKTSLCYAPPDEIKYIWKLHPAATKHCPHCLWLAQHSPFSLSSLPTFPKEGKTYCKEKCNCSLEVLFPNGIKYALLPSKNSNLYEHDFMVGWISEEMGHALEKETKTLSSEIGEELEPSKNLLVGLWIDYQNMNKLDKAFMIFAAQPLIRDILIAYIQACKEVYLSQGLSVKESLCTNQAETQAFADATDRVVVRLLNEGQIKEVQKQLSLIESLMMEVITSVFLSPITKYTFNLLKKAVSKIKDFTDAPVIGGLIKAAITDAQVYQKAKLRERIKLEERAARETLAKLKLWSLQAGDIFLKGLDGLMIFYKDCVLIFLPGVPIRNIADNTIKMINEMFNAFVRGSPFWAFWGSKQVRLMNIPKEVAQSAWKHSSLSSEIAQAESFFGKANCFWQVIRSTLYEYLLGKPEKWARAALWAGKMTAYEKELVALGKNASYVDGMRFAEKKVIEEVNRVFFDYSTRMAIEIPLARLAPFEFFNIRNFAYWLEDFSHFPWKLSSIKSIWDFWKSRRDPVEYRIRDKIPALLIPGTFFNPFAFSSAWDFIKVFAMSKGKPEWYNARERHLRWQAAFLSGLPAQERSLLLSLNHYSGVNDYLHRQKYKMVNVTVDFLDAFLGLHPALKIALGKIQSIESKDYITVFPQGPLVSAMTSAAFNDFYGSIQPPSTVRLGEIYVYMESVGLERDRDQAYELHRAWEVQKIGVQYFIGMYLQKSWKEIAKMHNETCKACETPGG